LPQLPLQGTEAILPHGGHRSMGADFLIAAATQLAPSRGSVTRALFTSLKPPSPGPRKCKKADTPWTRHDRPNVSSSN